MNHPPSFLVLLVATALTMECSNFRATDEGGTLHSMNAAPRWAPYDGPTLPAPRRFPTITPTPHGTILFGGLGPAGPLADPWRWDGTAWFPLATDAAPRARTGHAAAWVGDLFCVWGGRARSTSLDDGACWDAAANRWQPVSTDGVLSPRDAMASAVAGHRWMLWGGHDADGNDYADGALYDATTQGWSPLPEGGPRARHGAFASVSPDGARVLIWGGAGEAIALGSEDAAVFDLTTSRWSSVDLGDAPPARTGPVAVAVPGGLFAVGRDGAARFEWATGRWRAIDLPSLSPRWGMAVVVRDATVTLWGGRDEAGLRADGAVYDLATDRWTPLSIDDALAPREDAVGIADARQVLLLWGADATGLRADGLALR